MKKLVSLFPLLLFFCLFNPSKTVAQKVENPYTREFSIKTENDAYLLKFKDAYYTNGIFLNYAFVGKKSKVKTIYSAELGQMLFTPLIRKTKTPADIDRPYAGYLYAKYEQKSFIKNDAVVQFSGTLGVVGKISWGEGMQNTYHSLLGYSKFEGWQYQISNALVVNLAAAYSKNLLTNNGFKIMGMGNLNIGTGFTNAQLGLQTVVGAFEENNKSALWNARIANEVPSTKTKHEFFAYWHPKVIAQAYNITIQGSILTDGGMEVTRDLSPWMFQQTIGLCYAAGRIITKIEFVHQSKETPSQNKAQQYIGVQMSYRMH